MTSRWPEPEKYFRQDPFVYAKYQTMKKQYLLLCENNVTSDADKNILSKPIGTTGENPSLRTDDGVLNYIFYSFALFTSLGFYFLICFVCKN